ncbi:leukocyte antigen CD37-like isoform X5 [Vanacampus margaritifer]
MKSAALGLAVACCGVWICFDTGSLIGAVSSHELRAVGAGLMLIGSLAMACSLVAGFGARWQKEILMLICAGGLLFLFLCCVGLLLLLLLSKGQIEEQASSALTHMIRRYRGSGGRQDGLLDHLQRHEACCGLTGPSDWLQNSLVQTLNASAGSTFPCSCFRRPQGSAETAWCSQDGANRTYTQGCRERLSDWLHDNVVTVVAMDVSLMAAQVLQMALVLTLWRTFRHALRTTRNTNDGDSAHQMVRSDT